MALFKAARTLAARWFPSLAPAQPAEAVVADVADATGATGATDDAPLARVATDAMDAAPLGQEVDVVELSANIRTEGPASSSRARAAVATCSPIGARRLGGG